MTEPVQTPSIGRIVLFNWEGQEYPADVIWANANNMELLVKTGRFTPRDESMMNESNEPLLSVRVSVAAMDPEGRTLDHWRWPPRV